MKTNYPKFFEAVKQWQRAIGATCTICWQNNMHIKCDACGYWGKVVPDGVIVTIPPPIIADYIQNP